MNMPSESNSTASNRAPGDGQESNPAAQPNRGKQWLLRGILILLVLTTAAAIYFNREFYLSALNQGTLAPLPTGPQASAAQVAGPPAFDLSKATIPVKEIRHGGPPKDGIPALTDPATIPADEADYLDAADRVVGVSLGGESRAYPLRILNYHEVVNDTLGGVPVAVTYCPLCDSAVVFDRRTPLGTREFGVSGLLYNSNVLIYDRAEKESLWSQMKGEGVSGPAAGKSLTWLPFELTRWHDWRQRHEQTTVLSGETGHRRNYQRNPYASYFERDALMFPAGPLDDQLPNKEAVLGVWTDEAARAYPVSLFNDRAGQTTDKLNGKAVTIEYDPRANRLRVVKADEGVRWMYSLWFAWHAFRPHTDVYAGDEGS